MKEYVLDDTALRGIGAPRAVPADAPFTGDGTTVLGLKRESWRALGLLLLLEPIALVALYVAIGEPGLPWSSEQAVAAPALVQPALRERPPAVRPSPAAAPVAAAPRTHIAVERGRYVVNLSDAPADVALVRLAAVTRSEVSGQQIFHGGAVRLTRSVVASSPREAWQAVFGDVASFAIGCAGDGCRVRFVSLAETGPGRHAIATPQIVEERVQGAAVAPVAPPAEPVRPAPVPVASPPVVVAPAADDPNASEN